MTRKKMMNAVDIEWDVDMNDVLDQLEEMSIDELIAIIGNERLNAIMHLPNNVEIPEEIEEDEISDYLSEITGFCHKGYKLCTREY